MIHVKMDTIQINYNVNNAILLVKHVKIKMNVLLVNLRIILKILNVLIVILYVGHAFNHQINVQVVLKAII